MRRIHQRRDVAHRADIDLTAGQKRHRAVEVDGKAALDAVEDHPFAALAFLEFFLEQDPALFPARLFAREHRFAERILNPLEINLDFVPDTNRRVLARERELFHRNPAFGLEPDIDYRQILLDGDNLSFDNGAFFKRGHRERFLQ